MIDPFTFVVVAGTAGVEQAQNHFAGYGQGAQGYGSVSAPPMPIPSRGR